MQITGRRVTCSYRHRVTAAAHVVHALLCPVREAEWIPGWTCEVLYSRSGFAEQDGIFVAGLEGMPRSTFFVTRFDPPRELAYLVLAGSESGPAPWDVVDMLRLVLEDSGDGGTIVHWHRAYTALTPEGGRVAEARAAAFEARVPRLAELLEQHVTSSH